MSRQLCCNHWHIQDTHTHRSAEGGGTVIIIYKPVLIHGPEDPAEISQYNTSDQDFVVNTFPFSLVSWLFFLFIINNIIPCVAIYIHLGPQSSLSHDISDYISRTWNYHVAWETEVLQYTGLAVEKRLYCLHKHGINRGI